VNAGTITIVVKARRLRRWRYRQRFCDGHLGYGSRTLGC
jgi:hypothetical protein